MNDISFLQNSSGAVFHQTGVTAPVRILLAGDLHLSLADTRDDEFKDNYSRMHRFQKKQAEAFERIVGAAKKEDFDLLLLAGDLISFPTLANIEFIMNTLGKCEIPWLFTAGNHDWHFEGLPGTEIELRNQWTQTRLLPLHQGGNPLMAALDINGLRIIAIDNSVYEILPGQLEFFREQIAGNRPAVLMVHVPMYVPGRNIFFGCGHPDWNAAHDPYWQIERRPQWPAGGHSVTTMAFHKEVFEAENLLGILAGHTHQYTTDVFHGKIQLVTGNAGNGDWTNIRFE